jgi:hypothetical protein
MADSDWDLVKNAMGHPEGVSKEEQAAFFRLRTEMLDLQATLRKVEKERDELIEKLGGTL